MVPQSHRVFLVLALASLTGCRIASHVDPEAQIVLTGTALREDKTPLTGSVNLFRATNNVCVLGKSIAQLPIGTDGSFRHEMTGADTQTQAGDALCFRAELPSPTDMPKVSVEFFVQVEDVKVPPLQYWAGGLASAPADGGTTITFKDLAETHDLAGGNVSYAGTVETANDSNLAGFTSSPAFVAAESLEDFGGLSAKVSAKRAVKGSGTTFEVSYVGRPIVVPSGTRVPVSRGASCAFSGSPATCPFTDGKLDIFRLVAKSEEISFTLPAAKLLKKAVVRRLTTNPNAAELVLEGSPDNGVNWVPLTSLLSAGNTVEGLVSLSETAPAVDKVRIRGKDPSGTAVSLTQLAELSLFE